MGITTSASDTFLLSFDAPNYAIDRKGRLIKVPHQNELSFRVLEGKKISYLMETKYMVIEDDTNIYYTHKKYDAYFTMKRPVELKEENYENKFSLEISLQNNDNDEIVLISLYKYKLIDFLAKLGGIMKIITFVKMTGKFWSSYFYEKTLYNLLVKRENPYLSQKKKLFKSILNKTSNNNNNMNNSINNSIHKLKNSNTYASYSAWFINRFCKPCLIDQDAKQKREMLSATLGLDNYLLHLDYIDRQILLEQFDGDINKRIDEIVSKNKDFDNEITNDSTKVEFRKGIKDMELELNNQGENNLNKHLNSKE